MKPVHRTPADFWSRVPSRPRGGCWRWEGSMRNRYGEFHFYEKPNRVLAHREAWRLAYGQIPRGTLVCHTCDNPRCVRPSHLFLGTVADNNQDRARKGRSGTPGAKLTPAVVAALRLEWGVPLGAPPWTRGRVPITVLAARHGLGRVQMSRVLRGQCWPSRTSRTVVRSSHPPAGRGRPAPSGRPGYTPCCPEEKRSINGGCLSCGDPSY